MVTQILPCPECLAAPLVTSHGIPGRRGEQFGNHWTTALDQNNHIMKRLYSTIIDYSVILHLKQKSNYISNVPKTVVKERQAFMEPELSANCRSF